MFTRKPISAGIGLILLSVGLVGVSPELRAATLPDLGDPTESYMNPEQDRLLGEAFMRSLRRQVTIIGDPEINAYINSLGLRLLSNTDSVQRNFSFFIIDSPDINAFAAPGGYIGLNSGLILRAKEEGELASVVAHEIAHVTQRHLARRFEKADQTSLQTAAALIAAILLAGKNPEVAEAAIMTSVAGNIQQQLNFSREHEKEADRVGIDILSRSGYDPIHMAGFFHSLQESYRFQQSALPEILRTHPVTPSRIADAQSRAQSAKPQTPYAGDPNFSLIQTKLRTTTIDPSQRETRRNELFALLKKNEKAVNENDLYEYALLSLQGNYLDAAQSAAEQLIKHKPEHLFFISLMARIEATSGDLNSAIKRLTDALKLYPSHAYLSYLHANALRLNEQPLDAVRVLKHLTQTQANLTEPIYFKALAQAYDQAGDDANAFIAMADYYYLLGHTRTAITQLDAAMKKLPAADQFRRQKVEGRIEQLKAEALLEEEALR